MDLKRRLGHFDTVVSSTTTSITNHHRNLATVLGNSEIIVRQVRNTIHYLLPHLKGYQNEIWELITNFNAFNINSIPILQNAAV